MSPQARVASRCCHGLIALVIAAALVIQLVLIVSGGTDANSGQAAGGEVSLGVRLWRLFSYFTIQSNLFALAACLVLAFRPQHDGRGWRVVRLDALLGIVITGLVYATVLAPLAQPTGAAQVANVGFHYVSPWATLAAWLLFGPRPRITWPTVALAFGWPALWLVYTFTQGAFTGWYPYPFVDVSTIGYGTAIRNALVVLAIGIGLALLLKVLDGRLPVVGVYGRDRERAAA